MRSLLITNPLAGRRGPRNELPAAIAELRAGGWQVETAETQGPDDAHRLAEQASRDGVDVVIAVGGDGTVNQVAGGLLAAQQGGSEPAALAILPAGTANVLARDLGLPVPAPHLRDTLVAAARLLVKARVEKIDVGCASNDTGERIFICWAGVGLDAAITAHTMANPKLKHRLGVLSYVPGTLRQVAQLNRAPRYTVTVDDTTWVGKGVLAVVSNIEHYAVVIDMAPEAALNDGLLDVAFFHSINLRNGWLKLLRLSAGHHIDDPGVGYAKAQRIVIEAETPQPVHLDAEPFGSTPLTIWVIPQTLPLLVPPSPAAERLVPPAQST